MDEFFTSTSERLAAYRAEAQAALEAAEAEGGEGCSPEAEGRVAYWAGAQWSENPHFDGALGDWRDLGAQHWQFHEWADGWMREHRNFNAAEAADKTRAA